MKLYNSLSRDVEPFTPQGRAIGVYVCGITPYDTTHLGHLFTYSSFDILIRYLEFLGHQVCYVQNVTDIDDDILRKARQANDDWHALGNRWTSRFIRDMQAANIRPPDHFPRATDAIPQMFPIIDRLVKAGLAYESTGCVYFDVNSWPSYGRLSTIPRDQMLSIANERGNHPDDPLKRHPLDFVLWQAQAPGEPAWPSPWGLGRPGWHIECTTMATHFLGSTVDIHGGGADLIFPHHESEIAQSEGATGQAPFVRFWMHTAMVRHEGEKMSKSLGNLVMVQDLRQTWSANALRLYLANHHYREAWSHDPDELEQAERLVYQLDAAAQAQGSQNHAAQGRQNRAAQGGSRSPYDPSWAQAAFTAAMDHDLDTPAALPVLEQLARETMEAASTGQDVQGAQDSLIAMAGILGMRLGAPSPQDDLLSGWNQHLKRFSDEA
jgi:L-cysteine:1D-myo-inositol 2-amino-2-deoxy-alpha-D-glucopyranoside ligase